MKVKIDDLTFFTNERNKKSAERFSKILVNHTSSILRYFSTWIL